VILTFGIFFTPVFYEVNMFGKWSGVLLLNPVAPILESIKACIVYHHPPDYVWLAYSAVFSCFIVCVGYSIFKKLEPKFAESI
jgi:lipopolysaccharide transport system permease protein